MLTSASKDILVKLADQCINIPNIKEGLNVLRGGKKCKRENHYSNINHLYKMFKGTFPGIQKSEKNLISLYMVEYITTSTLKFLVVTVTGL